MALPDDTPPTATPTAPPGPAALPGHAVPPGPAVPPGHADWAWDARRISLLAILTFARLCLNTLLRIVYPFAPAFARGLGVPVTTVYFLSLIHIYFCSS